MNNPVNTMCPTCSFLAGGVKGEPRLSRSKGEDVKLTGAGQRAPDTAKNRKCPALVSSVGHR